MLKINLTAARCLKEEKFIDPDGKYSDYGTGTVTSDNIFDDRTHVPFYDQLFTKPDYMAEEENLKGHIEMMSPKEYYEICATRIFPNSTVEALIRSRSADPRVLDEIKEIIVKYKRQVFLPYLNYASNNQEGLHRMLAAAELFGWDHKFPVLIIEWADEERAKRAAKEKHDAEIIRHIGRAVDKTVVYTFRNLQEFKEELEMHLNNEFRWTDETVETLELIPQDDEIVIKVNDYTYIIETYEVQIEPPTDDGDTDDIELSDEELFDIDNLSFDEFIKKYS